MPVTLKCAACGTAVEFQELSPTVEATCPGCEVKVRYRKGDTHMAIPVSMSLPESFRHVDLDSVAGKSAVLVGRSRKPTAGESEKLNSDLVLAKALETLAHSIGHLEKRLDREEMGGPSRPGGTGAEAESSGGNGHRNGATVVLEAGDEEQEVVQLGAEKAAKPSKLKLKATPVGAQVLVRREAAREAHAYRREKHSQADWDDHAEVDRGPRGFGWLMQHFPKTTILVTMLCAGALITWTIIAMDEMFTTKSEKVDTTVKTRTTSLSRYWDEDPEAAQAEIMARGFLNATSVETAAPFVFESEAIREQLEKYYKPLATPGDYELTLKSRARAPEGQSVFAYNVVIPGEEARRLVVLPEGNLPKVFWQFFAEMGDMSWDEFVSTRPVEPVEMRVWIHPGQEYFEPYDRVDWQSYILHDWAQKQQIFAFANRGTSEDWRVADALEKEPVKFNRHSAVMALVKVSYMATLPGASGRDEMVVELKEVISTSWLPKRFRPVRSPKK